MLAVWGTDYDYRTDKCYSAPVCPECKEPVIFDEDRDFYYCVSCQNDIEVTEEMAIWFKDRAGTKTEMETCIWCKSKTLYTTFRKNRVTLKWEAAFGSCTNCGSRFIV